MERLIILLLIISINNFHLIAQENLVPNPSFESSTYCNWEVWGETSGKGADEWDSYRGSTDYMNACNSWSWSKFMGPQTASSGTGYAGFYAYTGTPVNGREILGAKLLAPLIKGKKYYVSMKFSLAEGYPDIACNNVGVLFLTKSYRSNTFKSIPCETCLNYLPGYAHVYSEMVIKEYNEWTEITGEFIADSSYSHLAIGNFFTDDHTITEKMFPNNRGSKAAYYYVDDVSVTKVCELSNCEILLELPNVFTPNSDGFNDLFVPIKAIGVTAMNTSIYNRWGKLLFTTDNPSIEWNGKIDSEMIAPGGLYYWMTECTSENGVKSKRKGWLSLVR